MTSALDQEISAYEKQLRQCYSNKDAIMWDLDSLDYDDKHYKRRKADLDDRLYRTYDKMDETVALLSKLSEAKHHIVVKVDMDELDLTSAEAKATYKEIEK